MKVLAFSLLAAICVTVSRGTLLEESPKKTTDILRAHITIIYDILEKECPSSSHNFRRDFVDSSLLSSHLDILEKHYNQLLKKLVECRNAGKTVAANQTTVSSYSSTTSDTELIDNSTTVGSTRFTTTTTTTTSIDWIKDCHEAINFTE